MVRGIAAAKAKETNEARRNLERALINDPDFDQKIEIWWWLSEISSDPVEQRQLVEDILAYRPTEARARRKLAILNGHLKPEKIIDPDRIPTPVPNEQAADASRFTCSKCGGRMSFAPDGESLTCEYCSAREALARAKDNGVAEQDFILALSTTQGHLAPSAFQTFSCQGCGASFILSAQQLTFNCPYCDSSYVVRQKDAAEYVTPGGVIPFRIDKRAARQAFHTWLRENMDGKQVRVGRGAAFYLPAWTFDLIAELDRHGFQSSTCSPESIPLGDRLSAVIDDLIIPATRRLGDTCLAELEEFDLSALVPYDERFLANWPAETYQISAADASLEARRLAIKRELKDQPSMTINPARLAVISYRLILLPVWLSHYTYEGRRFEVVINGHSGAVRAEKPAGGIARWLGLS